MGLTRGLVSSLAIYSNKGKDKGCEDHVATANKNKRYLQECMGFQVLDHSKRN
jgi:hypothetical protein